MQTIDPPTNSITQSLRAFKSAETISRPNTFICFSRLPAELRLKIWKTALPAPRIILCSKSFPATIPALFHSTRESRRVALEHYLLANLTDRDSRYIYVDYNNDTFYYAASTPPRILVPPLHPLAILIAEVQTLHDISSINCELIAKARHIAMSAILLDTLMSPLIDPTLQGHVQPENITRVLDVIKNSEVLQSITIIWASKGEGLGENINGDTTGLEFVAGPPLDGSKDEVELRRSIFESKKTAIGWKWNGELRFGNYKLKE